jgi:hypothetical protein
MMEEAGTSANVLPKGVIYLLKISLREYHFIQLLTLLQ